MEGQVSLTSRALYRRLSWVSLIQEAAREEQPVWIRWIFSLQYFSTALKKTTLRYMWDFS